CREPKRQFIRPRALKHDGNVWEDDSVEIFIDPAGDRKSYVQLIVNAAGVTYEGREKDGTWNGTLLNQDDPHPTADRADVTPESEPTPENLRESGYLLRGWLSVRKLAEVKARAID
ncbi:MAG: hypothetical protein MUQ26_06785, partial [Armatimonadetes bacterium]|nr:hypothetical protein [Armatimonadota bacterium]